MAICTISSMDSSWNRKNGQRKTTIPSQVSEVNKKDFCEGQHSLNTCNHDINPLKTIFSSSYIAHTFSDAHLRHVIQDLFLAGSETTTTTLRWSLLYLVKYPEIQEKVFAELENAIGHERTPSMSDKKNTPYTGSWKIKKSST